MDRGSAKESRIERWSRRIESFLEKLAAAQFRRAGTFVAISFALGLACLPLILRLSLNSEFTALLPENAQSVRDLDEIQARFGGQQAMMLTIEAPDQAGLFRFVRLLAPRLEGRDDLKIAAVDWNVGDFESFVTEHRHLYAPIGDLREIRDALSARLDYERARANPFYIDLGDEEPPDPRTAIDRMQAEATDARDEMRERFPDGFFRHPDRPLVLLIIHTRIRGAAKPDVDRLVAGIRSEAARLQAPADLRIRYGGTLMEIREETSMLESAMLDSLLLTLGLVSLSILLFFLRWRPVPLLILVLIPPIMMTFAFAEVAVDYLNASSAFLTSIVVGNGVNSSIIWLARYFEERRAGVDLRTAIATSHKGTWKGTLTAAMAAAVSYGSLMSTDYRGFRDFGVVGGIGMVLCWVATLLLLPALAVLFERARPLRFKGESKLKGGFYGVAFAKLAFGSPRFAIVIAVLLTLGLGAAVVQAGIENPLEYDYSKMRSERDPNGDVTYVGEAARAVLTQTATGSSLAVLAPSHDEVVRFRDQLEGYRRAHPRDIGALRSIDDLLPADQAAKIPVLTELRTLMLEVRPRLAEDQQRLVDEHLPPSSLHPVGPNDLPQSVARAYTERDGTRGRLLFVESNPGENNWDGRYMIRWAAAARSLRARGADHPPPVAGTGTVFADLLETVWREAPRAIGVALLATIAMLLLTFRTGKERWLTLGALLVGVLWMSGILWLLGVRLNFLNIIAYPIAFGTGVDYAVNVMRRYVDEKDEGREGKVAIRASVEETGGAVILCSLTTLIGYFSLHTSTNQGLRSFGDAMATAEVTCLLVAVLALPALVYWLDSRRAKAPAAASPDPRPSQV